MYTPQFSEISSAAASSNQRVRGVTTAALIWVQPVRSTALMSSRNAKLQSIRWPRISQADAGRSSGQ